MGDFTLASGKKATYYLDGKQVTLDPLRGETGGRGDFGSFGRRRDAQGHRRDVDRGRSDHVVRGRDVGRAQHADRRIFGAQRTKGHGTNQYVEGPVKPGDSVAIVEDVVTTGGSSLEAIERVEAFGLKVQRMIAIIDRMEGGAEAFAKRGYKFSSLLTIRDFGIEPPKE